MHDKNSGGRQLSSHENEQLLRGKLKIIEMKKYGMEQTLIHPQRIITLANSSPNGISQTGMLVIPARQQVRI